VHKRVLGIDYGSRRIGIAISDPLRLIARALTVVQNSPSAVDEIRRLAEEYDVDTVVVGLPLNLKGESGMKAVEVGEFIDALRRVISCTIATVDERFTSSIAAATLRTMGTKKTSRREKGTVDAMAAALIAQSFLDRERAGEK
jgi:putative Holliday junction resolvase